MAETGGKKGKKKKGKTVNLVEFLTDNQNSTASLGPVLKSTSSWADESEDLPTEVDSRWPDDSYGGSSAKRQMNLAALPTAPRASLEMQIDYSKIPEQPPFTAFLGNLPYDVEKVDILDYFKDIKITEVRLPQDASGGRAKGFGYAEFADKESLVQALSLNNETLRGRKIRIDIAGQNQGGDRDRGDKDDGPDLTMGDWRAQPDEPPSRSGNRYGSSNGYQDRYSRDSNRYDRRDDGWGRDSDRGRYHDYDDQRDPDYIDDRRPRDRHDSNRYGDQYDNCRHGHSYQRDSWGGRYGDRDRRDGRGGRDTNDPYAGAEFTRDQARPPVAKAPSSQNGDSLNDREDRSSGDMDDRGYGDRGSRGYGDRDRGYGDRDRGYGDRDRGYGDRDRGYGDRDRGYGDRDRGYGDRDRGYGDRDRGYGDRDRGYGDRDRGYGDRDRGYGDRDRGYGDRDRGYGDRDRRYGDRDGRYGDRDRGYGDRSRGFGDRDRGYGDRDRDRGYGDRGRDFGDRDGYRRDYGSRGGQDEYEPVKERPRLQLKPRSKPVEEAKPEPAESRSPSIFGGAKPVDTTVKEKEIEEKLEKLKVEVDVKKEKEHEGAHAKEGEYRSRRDSSRSSEGETRSRKDSGRSSEENGPASSRGHRDSEKSLDKEGTATNKESVQDAPPPPVNVWKQRMDAQKAGVLTSDKPKDEATNESNADKPVNEKTAERKTITSNAPTSPVGRGSNPRQHSRGSERGSGTGRGRGRGRGEHHSRTHEDGRNREEKRERKEKKTPELKKVEDQPPVFHQTSKFSLLMDEDDEDNENESAET